MVKYTNPTAHGYLMEAKACEKVIKELHRIAEKFQRTADKELAARQQEFEKAAQYTQVYEIQDDYGWGFITKKQYEQLLDIFNYGQEALDNMPPSNTQVALKIIKCIINDVEADRRELEFSSLSADEKEKKRIQSETVNYEWKKKLEEIKRRRCNIPNGS